jgi:hypothetical protein
MLYTAPKPVSGRNLVTDREPPSSAYPRKLRISAGLRTYYDKAQVYRVGDEIKGKEYGFSYLILFNHN